jgi:hypothetical protein
MADVRLGLFGEMELIYARNRIDDDVQVGRWGRLRCSGTLVGRWRGRAWGR